jgi:LysR family transcriptional activator of nhaA
MRTSTLRRLNFRHLYYFWVVAREEHLTRAAGKLHVSQSAISSQIRLLEDELGQELFVRDGRSLRLTEVGSLVLSYADSIFDLGTELLETVRSEEGGLRPELRVGALATLSRNFQQNFLRPVISDQHVRLVLESASLTELLERLRVHRLDLILSNRLVTADEQQPLYCRRIARQSVCLVGPPGRGRFRFPEDLGQEALVLPGHSSEIRGQFDLMCEELGVEPKISAEVDDMAMLRLLARDSGSLAMVPEVVVQDELREHVLAKYCEVPGIFENFYAITAKRHFQSAVLKSVLDAWTPPAVGEET